MSLIPARPLAALLALILTAAAPAGATWLNLTPQRPATAAGQLKGDQIADYAFVGTEGHTLSVTMTTANRSAHFNLTAPGSDTAMFIGSIDGNRFSGKLPATGAYRLRVYLMRSAARRGDSADFRLRAWVLPTR